MFSVPHPAAGISNANVDAALVALANLSFVLKRFFQSGKSQQSNQTHAPK